MSIHKDRNIATPEDVIEKIKDAREEGFGFIPLAGAGLSAPAGLPVINGIENYLRRAICIALRLDQTRFTTWDPRRHEWPSFDDPSFEQPDWQQRVKTALDDLTNTSTPILNEYSHLKNSTKAVQEAFGAMADWRSALQYLSRITRTGQQEYRLAAPDPEVVDRFFLRVVNEGYKPTTAHRSLALLSELLRIETILTTNFDDLIESAFHSMSRNVTTFDVHVTSGLPPFDILQQSLSVVKLHGGRYGLRADYSLDTLPTESDQRHFLSYLAGQQVPDDYQLNPADKLKRLPTRNHLLVMGMSGNDSRINALIQTARLNLDEHFRIYWLCFTGTDVVSVRGFQKWANTNRGASTNALHEGDDGKDPTFLISQHQNLGLYLLELYQQLALGLPSAGTIYPSAALLPVPVHIRPPEVSDVREELRQALGKKIRDASARNDPSVNQPHPGLVVASSAIERQGITAIASDVFRELQDEQINCVWIDMDEADNSDELTESILHAFARFAGVQEWIPAVRERDSTGRIRELQRYMQKRQGKWILFLNARDAAGSSYSERTTPNGWLDGPEEGDKFVQIVREMVGPECPHLAIVLCCYDKDRKDDEAANRDVISIINSRVPARHFRLKDDQDLPYPTSKKAVESAMEWVETSHDKARFLLAMTLVRRSRYPSLLWSWAFHGSKSTSDQRTSSTAVWLKELESLGVLYRKPGGFVWMHSLTRDKLRETLQADGDLGVSKKKARILHGLAEWFQKLFFSSRDPMAAFDACEYRLLNAAECLTNAATAHSDTTLVLKNVARAYNALLDTECILALTSHDLLSSGYSKSLCRRLDHIRNIHAVKIRKVAEEAKSETDDENVRLALLRLDQQNDSIVESTFKLNRAIAHEVDEIKIAFDRHHQWRKFKWIGEISIVR